MSDSFSFLQPDSNRLFKFTPKPAKMDQDPAEAAPKDAQPPAVRQHGAPPNVPAQPDRRRKRRALISAPIRVRTIDVTSEGPDEISTTVDVSRNGILFLTADPSFHRGMEVAVTFPYTKLPGVPQSEQPGNVVRVSELSNGKIAVAVAFGFGVGEHIVDASGARLDIEAAPIANDFKDDEEESKKPLILAVESDQNLRCSLKSYLTTEGYRVIAVDSASDAREVLNMMTPALMIAEIEGEGLPGFDLCAYVKGTPRLQHVPVMLTTASAYPSDYSAAHSLGAVVCMAKPYRQERLGHVVRLLVAPVGAPQHAEPPRTPDPTRRHRIAKGSRRGISGPEGLQLR
jgi:CheY-like chemotaxis protein